MEPNKINTQAAVNTTLQTAGRNEAVLNQVDQDPLVLQGIVVWPMAKAFVKKKFFDPTKKIPAAFAGESVYPTNYSAKFVVVSAVEFIPDLLLKALEVGGTTADAYNNFIRGTQLIFKVDGRPMLTTPLLPYLVHRSINPGTGTPVLVSNTQSFGVALDEPIKIPIGKFLEIEVTPPDYIETGVSAATNSHYPGFDETKDDSNRGCALHCLCYGTVADQAW